MLNAGLSPVVLEHGSLGCSGDLAPLAHCALAVMGEGEVVDGGVVRPAAEALADHGLEPVELAEKEGLALINGTEGMLGMLVLALHDLRRLLDVADLTAALSIEGLMGTDRVLAPDLQALRPHPGQATSAARMAALLDGLADRGQPPVRRRPGPGRVLDALRSAGARRRARHRRPRRHGGRARARRRDRQPVRARRRTAGVARQLPRRPAGVRARLPRHRDRRRREHERAPDRPLPRRQPQPRPAALPRRRPRRRLRPDDRPVHPGGDGQRAQAAGRAGERRLHPVQRDAGGPRVDGLVVRAQAAARGGGPDPGARDRADDRRPWRRAAGTAATGRRHRRRHRRPEGEGPAGRDRTGSSPPTSRRPPSSSAPAPSSQASEDQT